VEELTILEDILTLQLPLIFHFHILHWCEQFLKYAYAYIPVA